MTPTTIALRNLDPQRGGRAELTIDAPEIVPARLSVTIRRGTQNKGFLGPSGWQQSEHLFLAQSFHDAGDRLVLVLGPEVVDNELRDFDVLELTFPEVGMVGQVVWEGITRSVALIDEPVPPGGGAGTRTGGGSGAGAGGGSGPGGSAAGPSGPGTPGTVGGTDGGAQGVNGSGRSGGGAVPPGPGLPRWLLVAAALLVVVLGAGALAYLKPWAPAAEPVAEVAPPAETPPETPPATPAEDEAPPEPAGDPVEEAYARGRAAIEAGDCANAQTELRPGMEAGHGPSLLLWAEQQDSVDFAPCLTETANDVRALTNYQKACEAGAAEALPALEALVADLTRRAGQGDPVAEDVLRVAVPKAVAACTP